MEWHLWLAPPLWQQMVEKQGGQQQKHGARKKQGRSKGGTATADAVGALPATEP